MEKERISKYSFWEELANTITHLVACWMVVAYMMVSNEPLYRLLSFSLGLTFFFSTLYHGAALLNLKKKVVDRFRQIDIMFIYVTIITTGLTWGMLVNTSPYIVMLALIPLSLIFFWVGLNYGSQKFEETHLTLTCICGGISSVLFYLGNWDHVQFLYFTIGILLYGGGTGFYVGKSEGSHAIWHIFVGLGAWAHLTGLNY